MFLARNHFMQLVALNLLFLICLVPVVTVPAAFTGVSRVLVSLARDGNMFDWRAFFAEFKVNFFKRLLIWLPVAAPGVILLFCPGLLAGSSLFFAAVVLLCLVSQLTQAYWFPMMALVELPAAACLKNAFILALLEWKCSLKIFAAVILNAVLVLFLPVSLGLMLCGMAFIQLYICVFANEAIQKRIIEPFKALGQLP